jgi:hypothetical protein
MDGKFSVNVNNRSVPSYDSRFTMNYSMESFTALDDLRRALVKQANVGLDQEFVKEGESTLDELRVLWTMVDENDDVADVGYRPMIAYNTAASSTASVPLESCSTT